MHASQPVHMSSSSNANTLGNFFFAIVIYCRIEPIINKHRGLVDSSTR
jgi:hypothetical protein